MGYISELLVLGGCDVAGEDGDHLGQLFRLAAEPTKRIGGQASKSNPPRKNPEESYVFSRTFLL